MKKLLIVSICLMSMTIIHGQDVISRLEIVNAKSGERRIVKEFDGRVEAPNWTPDGKYLVYNSGGLIYKIPVADGEPALISTGSVKGCNNDHVISVDGKILAISARGPSSHSQIYQLPLSGGEPTLVTPLGPSYLHRISPDNKYLAYCANRNGNYDVYVIPTSGGEEIRLTTTEGLDDGPEYSPDGKKVVYITYQKGDVEPGSHPPNKNVELNLMSAKGGESKTVVKLFGGQGTINVNSWSPDSKEFAFVSYELTGALKESSDVGNPRLQGSMAFDPKTQSYTLTGAGENVWAQKDEFQFAWVKVTGDFSMSTNFKFEGEGVNAHRKVGIMIRETLDGDSPYADVTVHGDGLTSLQYRMEKGAETKEIKADITGADHMVLERSGNKIAIKIAIGKEPSAYAAETEISLPSTCYVGIFICSHDENVVEKAYLS